MTRFRGTHAKWSHNASWPGAQPPPTHPPPPPQTGRNILIIRRSKIRKATALQSYLPCAWLYPCSTHPPLQSLLPWDPPPLSCPVPGSALSLYPRARACVRACTVCVCVSHSLLCVCVCVCVCVYVRARTSAEDERSERQVVFDALVIPSQHLRVARRSHLRQHVVQGGPGGRRFCRRLQKHVSDAG